MKLLVAAVAAAIVSNVAYAATEGLFAEQNTSADDVTVRRVRDTKEHVVCYIASGHVRGSSITAYDGRSVAVSCLPERAP